MPKSKINIDDDIDFEVQIDDFEIDSDDVFEESTQPLESDAPVEVDEQNMDGPANGDGTIYAPTGNFNDASPETRLISDFSVDYVNSQGLECSDGLIANTAYSNIEISPVQLGGHVVMYLPEENELAAQDADSTTIEFCFSATDASDGWYEVSDVYADEFVFAYPDTDNVIVTSGLAASNSASEQEKINDNEIPIQCIIETQSDDITATRVGQHQDQHGSVTYIWYDDSVWTNSEEFVEMGNLDFII